MKVLKGVPSFFGGRGWSLGTFSPLLGWFAAKVVSRAWSGFSYMPKLKKEACFRGRIVQTKESRSTASISGSSPGVTLGASCSSGAWRDGARGLAESLVPVAMAGVGAEVPELVAVLGVGLRSLPLSVGSGC